MAICSWPSRRSIRPRPQRRPRWSLAGRDPSAVLSVKVFPASVHRITSRLIGDLAKGNRACGHPSSSPPASTIPTRTGPKPGSPPAAPGPPTRSLALAEVAAQPRRPGGRPRRHGAQPGERPPPGDARHHAAALRRRPGGGRAGDHQRQSPTGPRCGSPRRPTAMSACPCSCRALQRRPRRGRRSRPLPHHDHRACGAAVAGVRRMVGDQHRR